MRTIAALTITEISSTLNFVLSCKGENHGNNRYQPSKRAVILFVCLSPVLYNLWYSE